MGTFYDDQEPSRLIQDDEGVWYLMPLELVDAFEEFKNGSTAVDETEFDYYRVDGPHRIIFTAWSEE